MKCIWKSPPNTLPTKTYIPAPTHFREKWGVFSMGGVYSRNQEKWFIFHAKVRELLKKGKNWYVSAYFHPGFHLIKHRSGPCNARPLTLHRKYLQFETMILASRKEHFTRLRFAYKRGVLLDLVNNADSL